MPNTPDETRAWCAYLAALITVTGNNIAVPISPKCTRKAPNGLGLTGCGTCFRCSVQLISRALAITLPFPSGEELENNAWWIANDVYRHVVRLDPQRFTDANGDDYAPMSPEAFARVMRFAATQNVPSTSSRPAEVPTGS